MSVPKHLSAFDGRAEDFEWTRIKHKPARPVPEPQVPSTPPTTPTLPKMKISATPISAEQLLENLQNYYTAMEKIPNWQVLLEAENLVRKQARIAARRERKLNRKGQLAA